MVLNESKAEKILGVVFTVLGVLLLAVIIPTQIAYVKNSHAISFIDGFSLALLPADEEIICLPVRDSRLTLAAFSALRWHSLPQFQVMLQKFQKFLA